MEKVSFLNVPSFLLLRDKVVQVEGIGNVKFDVAYGGAFYAFVSCGSALGLNTPDGSLIGDDAAFCRYVLNAQGLAVVPGRAFAMPGFFRLSYAYSEAELKDALGRLERATASLGPASATDRKG